ncbi:hypothetical protein ACJ8OF_23240, partial [Serratia sp. CY64661]
NFIARYKLVHFLPLHHVHCQSKSALIFMRLTSQKKPPNMLKTAAAFSLTIDTHLEFQQGGRRKKHSSKIQKKTNIKQKVIQT